MLCINLESDNPFFNLAIEEFLLKNSRDEYLILYVNSPSVIIGKHQTGHREVNTKFVTQKQIPVIRRISGGGTVYHDHGNLNYSFIRQCESGKQVDFLKYTTPVIEFLAHVGVDAKFGGKNDLKVDGYKISGNAEHVHGNRVLHHGTLLFNTSLDDLRNSIRKDLTQYSSRAVSSNPSQIRNLCDILERFSDVSEFRSEMLHYFIRSLPGASLYEISSIETMQAEAIALSKYQTWEWNWAYGPEYTFRNDFLHEDRPHSCSISVRDGIITGCTIEGSIVMNNLETKLIGCRHMVNDLLELFRQQNITLKDDEIYNFF